MRTLDCVLVTDGSSDRMLIPVLSWLMQQHHVPAPRFEWFDPARFREAPKDLAVRVRHALTLYPCDLLFVHRDSEGEPVSKREEEIRQAVEVYRAYDPFATPAVFVIPVRMTEAWFLFDEASIREAAGCPRGRVPLNLPRPGRCEEVPDPKVILHRSLRDATGKQGRQLAKFRADVAAHRLADLIPSYEPLRALPAFQRLERQLAETLQSLP
ncbi:MAG: hypothetical protein HY820_11120 [Acidobacteria bacterium]|nr:hypothetical protein [Acidobacteriota bacterium]